MNAKTAPNLMAAAVLAKLASEYLAKYGVTVTATDVLNLLAGAAVLWHVIGPILQRFQNPQQPVGPAKVNP